MYKFKLPIYLELDGKVASMESTRSGGAITFTPTGYSFADFAELGTKISKKRFDEIHGKQVAPKLSLALAGLKSKARNKVTIKAMENVVNDLPKEDIANVGGDQEQYPVKGVAAFTSFGVLISQDLKNDLKEIFELCAEEVSNGMEIPDDLIHMGTWNDLKMSIQETTALQNNNPRTAYCVLPKDNIGGVVYEVYSFTIE